MEYAGFTAALNNFLSNPASRSAAKALTSWYSSAERFAAGVGEEVFDKAFFTAANGGKA